MHDTYSCVCKYSYKRTCSKKNRPDVARRMALDKADGLSLQFRSLIVNVLLFGCCCVRIDTIHPLLHSRSCQSRQS